MSRFFSHKYDLLTPYTPGEQPGQRQYVKLNTNESPFPPSEKARRYAAEHTRSLELFSAPEAVDLTAAVAKLCGLSPREVLLTNGSDEILNFAFMAFCDGEHPAYFPDITYGFYPVFARLNGVPYYEIPLREDFSLCPEDYRGLKGAIFIANPNAPTGRALLRDAVEGIVSANPESVVVVDEAYVDFGGESCLPLIPKYHNLLVVQTFSKSRSMAGARLGFGAGCESLIRDLNTIKYSTNPYNVNSMTQAMGLGTLLDGEYTQKCCEAVMENRAYLTAELTARGFDVIPSKANFVFARTDKMPGEDVYVKLKEKGVLVRHFNVDRIRDYNRITVGSREQIGALLAALDVIL